MILKGTCTSASQSVSDHRIKVTVPGICDNMLVQTVNGLYLRSGDDVYVWFDDQYLCPLVLGRVDGQLELTKLVEAINNVTNHSNSHVHPEFAALLTFASFISLAAESASTPFELAVASAATTLNGSLISSAPGSATTKVSTIKPDDLLY